MRFAWYVSGKIPGRRSRIFFFSSTRRHTRWPRDWSPDVCSSDLVLRERAKDDSQGLLGFLKTVDKQWTVTWDENDDGARYKLREAQDLAWGAASDQSRDWKAIDPRRVEGPIPVECRSASCGNCWVGVLGGAEKLADVGAREGKKIKEYGYIDT